MTWSFCVHWVQMRGDSSLSWFWWNIHLFNQWITPHKFRSFDHSNHVGWFGFMVFKRHFQLVEETGVPGENHRPVVSHWQPLSHNQCWEPNQPTWLEWSKLLNLCGVIHWLNRWIYISYYHTIATTIPPKYFLDWTKSETRSMISLVDVWQPLHSNVSFCNCPNFHKSRRWLEKSKYARNLNVNNRHACLNGYEIKNKKW
jgi:hypothetical protein